VKKLEFLSQEQAETTDRITLMALEAQAGNDLMRETLLKNYTPFILNVASSACNRYLKMGEDDEASIGLLAFNEAIDKYSPDKGAKFLTFAEVVIKRRLTDFFRKESRFTSKVIPFNIYQGDDEKGNNSLEVEHANHAFQIEQEAMDKKQEIIQFSQALSKFNISLTELVKISPKHIDARQRAYKVAQLIVSKKELVQYFWEKKSLPLKLIENEVEVSRKTLERQRKYIIALILVLQGNFDHIQSYIKDLGKEG